MAIRDYWGFDNLPAITSGTGIVAFLRGDITVTGVYSIYGQITSVAGGWLGFTAGNNPYPNTNYGVYTPSMNHPYQALSDFTTRRSFIGFRINMNNNSVGTPVLSLSNTAGTKQALLTNTQLGVNINQYVEVMIDRANTQIVVWIDGVAQPPVFFDFNAFVSVDNKCNLVWGTNGNGPLYYFQIRDVYFLDDTQDATLCNRLGSIDIAPCALASVTAPNWTSSDSATPLADLSTVLGTTIATQTNPLQTEPPSMDPVQFQLSNAGLLPSEQILAVKADLSGLRTPSYAFAPKASMAINGQTVQGKQLTYPNGAQYYWNQNMFVLEKAPDGTAWTPQALAGMVATLTP